MSYTFESREIRGDKTEEFLDDLLRLVHHRDIPIKLYTNALRTQLVRIEKEVKLGNDQVHILIFYR